MRFNIFSAIAGMFLFLSAYSQQPGPAFRKVDDFKINDSKVRVYFKDPLAVLMSTLPDFESKPDAEKNKLLQVYLLNNDLYLFSVTSKDGKVTSYVVRGNPQHKETSCRYRLDITDGDILNPGITPLVARKTVSTINISGEFFEHMAPFQQPRFKKVTTSHVWGNLIHINPYAPIKETVEKMIILDQTGRPL